MEHPEIAWDPGLYRSVGLEPKEAKIVVVKSATQFRSVYAEIAKEMMVLDTPEASSAHFTKLPYKT